VKNRSAWLDEIDVQPRQTLESILLFTGCSPAYSPRNQNIAKAAAQLLDRMQVAFTTLGRKEVCCGDLALRAGDLKTFNKLKKTNQTGIADSKAQYVYTLSPHCFHTMQTSYFKENETRPALRPFILLLYDKLKSGALCFSRKIRKKVTYHDPCFLGRYNNIYDAPREIMESIEGLSLIEMKHNRQNSICCGGGGGGMCLDRESGERLGEIRLNEALAVNAEVVVTACPHCLTMLEDAAQSHPKYQDLKIMDVCELALQAV
jgi:Fe-S oxidoreductase